MTLKLCCLVALNALILSCHVQHTSKEAEEQNEVDLMEQNAPNQSTLEGTWFFQPSGKQCEPPKWESKEQIHAELLTQNISLQSIKEGFLMTCSACTCPTSRTFFIQITEQSKNVEWLKQQGWKVANSAMLGEVKVQ